MQPLEHKASPPSMKMHLELEGKLGPQPQLQPCISTFSHDKNFLPQNTLVPKKAEKTRRAKEPVKRKFKVRVIVQPMPTNPTLPNNRYLPAEPIHTMVNTLVTT